MGGSRFANNCDRLLGTARQRETVLQAGTMDGSMINGSDCPECGGQVSTGDGIEYVCEQCDREYDTADLFLP
jgi:tRNA(Ile2) C34 agmatinyltransferase TiaS